MNNSMESHYRHSQPRDRSFPEPLQLLCILAEKLYVDAEVNLETYRTLGDGQRGVFDRLLTRSLSTQGLAKFRENKWRSDAGLLTFTTEDFGSGKEGTRKENLIKIVLSLSLKVLKRQFRQEHKVSKSHRTGYYVNKAQLNESFYENVMGQPPTQDDASLLHQVVGGFTKGFFVRLLGTNTCTPKTGLLQKLFYLLNTPEGKALLAEEYTKGVASKLEAVFGVPLLKEEFGSSSVTSSTAQLEALEQRIMSKGTKLPRSLLQLDFCVDLTKSKLLRLCSTFGLILS